MKKTGFIAGAIFLGTLAFVAFTFAVMLLWNWLMPLIFNLGELTFWQAAGILVLSKILFSGFGREHCWHSSNRKKYWHSRFEEKWRRIPEEKKAHFAEKMKERGYVPSTETDEKE